MVLAHDEDDDSASDPDEVVQLMPYERNALICYASAFFSTLVGSDHKCPENYTVCIEGNKSSESKAPKVSVCRKPSQKLLPLGVSEAEAKSCGKCLYPPRLPPRGGP